MNKIKLVKNSRMSQIIIKSQKGQVLDDRGIYAIGNNQIKGLIKVNIEQKSTSFKLVYVTTGFIPLKEHLKNMMNKDMFIKFLQNILNVLQAMQDANFHQQCILFDINYVVVNPSTQSVYFIYVPIQNFEGCGTLRDFLLSLVQNGSFAPGEDSSYIRNYVSVLNRKSDFSTFDLRDYIRSVSSNENGGSPSSRVKCPKCGSPVADNIKFCASCGANVSSLTGDFHNKPNSFNQPSGEPLRPRRGDSQPIDLLGIPIRPPQPQTSNSPQNAPQFSPRNDVPQNVPQFSPRDDVPQNVPQFPPRNDVPQNVPQFPPRNDVPQNAPQFPPRNDVPQNAPQFPPRNDAPQNMPSFSPQSNISPNGLEYSFKPTKSSNVANMAGSFGKGQIPGDDPYFGGTVVLADESAKPLMAYLVRSSTGEKTAIDKPTFSVGRMLGHVDYCVMNNSAVGRQHINIINKNGRYFICDLNSTNGTYIDERKIPPNIETEVFSGSKVTLANEDFKFIIE